MKRKFKLLIISLLLTLILEGLLNINSITSFIYPKQTAEFSLAEGIYLNEQGNYVVIPNKEHSIYINNLENTPYTLGFSGQIVKSDWEIDNIPINISNSQNMVDYQWINYFELNGDSVILNEPAKNGKYLKLEILLPDYTEFMIELSANATFRTEMKLQRIILVFVMFLVLMIYIDYQN